MVSIREVHANHERPGANGWGAVRARPSVPVASVVAILADGMTAAEILAEHPDLDAGDIVECPRNAAIAVLERELPLRQPA